MTTGVRTTDKGGKVDTFCTRTPIRPNKAAIPVMSDRFVGEVLDHNEYGKSHCGWKP